MKAPAKINLFLDILRRRPDGYHDIHTVFHRLALADDVELVPVGIRNSVDQPLVMRFIVDGPESRGVPANENNLIWRALTAIDREANRPLPRLKIYLFKRIPHGAGLGGGSSDVAATLVEANERFRLGVSPARLNAIAATIGSDCPFFLLPPGAAEATGRGEILHPAPAREGQPVLLAMPDFTVGTSEAYGWLRPEHLGAHTDADAVRKWLADGSAALSTLHNTFEDALATHRPALREIRNEMLANGAIAARLTGSGSVTFGIFETAESRDAAWEAMNRPGLRVWATELRG